MKPMYDIGFCEEHKNQYISHFSPYPKDKRTFKCKRCNDKENAVNIDEIQNLDKTIIYNWPIDFEALIY